MRASDIVKKKTEATPSQDETASSKTDLQPDPIRLSDFMKLESWEAKTTSSADKDAPIKDKPIADTPIVDTPIKNTPIAEGVVQSVDDIYLSARIYMEGVRDNIRNQTAIDFESAISLLKKIVNATSTELLFSIHPLTLKLGKQEDYYIFQPVHTMIYALKIGFRLNYSHPRLIELGLATLLQNIGMFLVPDSIVHKTGNITKSEIDVIKQHPEMGRNVLLPYQKEYPWLPETVYQHHERENGQGYPRGLKGNEIVEYAKVIGICDSYEAMTHNRPHKKAIMQFDSVRQLIESRDQLFSPQILKVFLEEMSLYPIGSYVKLNNGAIGRVIRTNRLLPMKPVIGLLIDGLGNKAAAGDIIDLTTTSLLNIVDVIAEEDLPQ